MLNSLKQRLDKFNIFDEVFDGTPSIQDEGLPEEESQIEQSSLFKIPKYLETVNLNYKG
jgi:hypothetical protein